LKLITCTLLYIYVKNSFILDWRYQALPQSCCWTELGKHFLVCNSLFSTLFTLYILWFDRSFSIHLIPRLLLILVIGFHWYLPHESKFIDVRFVVIEFTTILYYEEKWTPKSSLLNFFLHLFLYFLPKPSHSFLFKLKNKV